LAIPVFAVVSAIATKPKRMHWLFNLAKTSGGSDYEVAHK